MNESDLLRKIASLSDVISTHKHAPKDDTAGPLLSSSDEKERLLLLQIARLREEIDRKKRPAPSSSASTFAPVARPPCRFFHSSGHCGKGLNCPFSHAVPITGPGAPAPWGGRGRGRGRGRGFAPRGGLVTAPGRGRGGTFPGVGGEQQHGTATTLRVGRGPGGDEEDKAKTLPVCFRFLLGSCFDEHCPYPHVNVNPLAAVCEDFLAGYCPQGSACKLLHTYECQTWVRTGECDDPQCRFKHPRNVRGRRRLPPVPPVAGSSALSSLPPLTSSDVIDQHRADNVGGEEGEEEEDDDDGRGRFRAQDDEEEDQHEAEDDEDSSGSDSASHDDHEARTKRRKLSALPDVLSGSIVPKFG